MRDKPLFFAWLASRQLVAAAGLLSTGIAALIFWLYGLPKEAIIYLFCLCAAGTVFFAGISFLRFWRKDKILRKMEEEILVTTEDLPEATTLIEADYSRLLHRLVRENRQLQAQADASLADLTAYYTLWVHQIKTPIAAMDLLLQSGPGKATELEIELQKISQYVDMVLQYLRLDSEAKDLVLHRCHLDQILRQTVRKYAKLFILKKIRLTFQETHLEILSDEKWLSFLLEQKGSRPWSSPIPALASPPRICPGSLTKALPATTAAWIKRPPASGFTSAAGWLRCWGTPFPSPPSRARGHRSTSAWAGPNLRLNRGSWKRDALLHSLKKSVRPSRTNRFFK